MLIHCCRDVFITPLRSNERDADHRKRRSSVVVRLRFRGNFLTESLLAMNSTGFQASRHNMFRYLAIVFTSILFLAKLRKHLSHSNYVTD
jgi:hypothetical protein